MGVKDEVDDDGGCDDEGGDDADDEEEFDDVFTRFMAIMGGERFLLGMGGVYSLCRLRSMMGLALLRRGELTLISGLL